MKKHADEIPLEPLDDSAASLQTLEEGKQNEEQNVLRQESDGEPIQWDGSEAELVTSGEDEEFEDVQAGIRLEYQLKADEIHCVLKRAKFYRKAMMKAKIETAVLGAMLLLFGLTWILKNDPNAMIFTIASAILIGLVWATPYFSLRSYAVKWAGKQEIEMEVYPDRIRMGEGEKSWKIPLDGSVICEEYNNLMVLHTGDEELTVLPLRCVEPQILPDIQAMIIAGTRKLET